jgi:hypothetical protein
MLFKALIYSSISSVLLPITFYFFAKKKSQVNKVLFILLVTSLLADVGSIVYVKAGFRGEIIPNIFFIAQVILLGKIYSHLLNERMVIFGILAGYLVLSIINIAFLESINEYQSLLRLLGNAVILGFAISYYQHVYKIMPIKNITESSPFWINNAVLYYFSLNFFLFAAANYIFKNEPPEVGMVFWSFHNFNNIVKNCLFAVAIYYGGRLKKKLS